MENLVGRKVIGFRFEDDKHGLFFSDTMEKYVGVLGEVGHLGVSNTVCVRFPDGESFYYPIELVKKRLVSEDVEFSDSSTKTKDRGTEKLTGDLIGRKMIGFRFESDEGRILFTKPMEKYVGSLGEIISLGMDDTVFVEFPDGSVYYYPIELVEDYLIAEGVEFTKDRDKVKVQGMEEMYVSGCDPYGVKDNDKKLPMSKLKVQFPNALQAVVLCSSMGHEKYKDSDEDWLNFTRVPGGSETYRDACERHSLYEVGDVDEESGLPHLFHELWNKMAEVEIWMRENYKEIT